MTDIDQGPTALDVIEHAITRFKTEVIDTIPEQEFSGGEIIDDATFLTSAAWHANTDHAPRCFIGHALVVNHDRWPGVRALLPNFHDPSDHTTAYEVLIARIKARFDVSPISDLVPAEVLWISDVYDLHPYLVQYLYYGVENMDFATATEFAAALLERYRTYPNTPSEWREVQTEWMTAVESDDE